LEHWYLLYLLAGKVVERQPIRGQFRNSFGDIAVGKSAEFSKNAMAKAGFTR